ncbi:DUF2326 domain-containing protein [Proteus mirabilis]|nr:DUF2326 domain-containing protein [Proteus mirabilis]MDM3623931.1 DUF2326 domain-containing protein [Proteus mirabilis]MED6230569.1 DUF2326 domain-containing protein [Proteus mirabilis]
MMKLLKLYSSNPKFKTITFNSGMNIVVGLQASKSSTDSSNGIGKSSSLNLVHLMLGGKLDKKNASDIKLKSFLSDYGDFYLDMLVGSTEYTIKLNFEDGIYYLNEAKIGKSETFGKYLSEKVFINLNGEVTFRQVFNCFARRFLPERNYYNGTLMQQGQPINDFYQRMVNLYLLGIDLSLPYAYKKTASKIDDLTKTSNSLEKANVLEDESELLDLKDKLELLLKDKDNFIIASNYDALKLEADELTDEINKIRNKVFSQLRELRNKRRILNSSKDVVKVDFKKVEQIFNEAKFHFSDKIQKRLEDATEFHIKIQESRRDRIEKSINEINLESIQLKDSLCKLENKRDNLLSGLSSMGALDEYNSIIDRIRALESEIAEISSHKQTLAKVRKNKAILEKQRAEISVDAMEYIEGKQEHLDSIQSKFRALVRRFYTHQGGSIRITKNEGVAKYLYDITIHIQKDSSQGVGEVKIFCYDILLYQLNMNLLGFLAHDSALFSGIDIRQIKTMFKISLEMCEESGLQYFVNLNKDIYDEITSSKKDDILSDKDKDELKKGTVLRLFDDKPENTLFGEYFG